MTRALERAHRDHRVVQSQLARLVRLASRCRPAAGRSTLRHEVPLFLREWGRRFDPHFRAEERASRAGVRRGFPPDLAGANDVRREREVVAAILDLLRARRDALRRGEPDAEADVAAAIKDLDELWHRHVRRLEVLSSLLARAREAHRG